MLGSTAAEAPDESGSRHLRDVQDRMGGVRLQQAISIALVMVSVAGFTVAWWR